MSNESKSERKGEYERGESECVCVRVRKIERETKFLDLASVLFFEAQGFLEF